LPAIVREQAGLSGFARVTTFASLELRAGPRALQHVREHGIVPSDVRCIPAAAGGPKGLALLPLDRRLHDAGFVGGNVRLVGASIGAWRMAALAAPDAPAAIARLQHAYVREQRYAPRPSPTDVSAVIRNVVRHVLDGRSIAPRPGVSLEVLTSRARGALAGRRSRAAFARAALSNAAARAALARHLERVVFVAGTSAAPDPFDAFGVRHIAFDAANTEDALLASGSIPLVCAPVSGISGAPPGDYWDGGLIDYHLLLPYARQPGLVLYPHFAPYVTPGWLDKFLPWRRAPRGHPWLANVLVIAPSRTMLARLPQRKLPDRNDFLHYGQDHAGRIRDWERAIAECERFADEATRWLETPDPVQVRRL
jgi:hypothetical protein